jgi:hypothetical protein
MSCLALSRLVSSCRVVSRRIVSCRVLSRDELVMSCRVVSCRVVSRMSCRVVSWLVLPCPVLSERVVGFKMPLHPPTHQSPCSYLFSLRRDMRRVVPVLLIWVRRWVWRTWAWTRACVSLKWTTCTTSSSPFKGKHRVIFTHPPAGRKPLAPKQLLVFIAQASSNQWRGWSVCPVKPIWRP